MDDPAEKQSQCTDGTGSPGRCPLRPDLDSPDRMLSGPLRSRSYEELFCNGGASGGVGPLASSLVSFSRPRGDVLMQGYLGKQERGHRRYFVLRADGRLEWFKNREKFTAGEKAAGQAALFASSRQGVIYLRSCLGVSWSGSRKSHDVVLYAKDQTVVLVAENQQEQEEWYLAIKTQMEEEKKDTEPGEGMDEEDDGYCTLPPAASFKEVWPVTVRPRGLGSSRSLAGEMRLCLTNTCLVLVKVSTCMDLPSVTIPLLSVRRFGHLDGSFFVELGRSAPNGPGEIWMEARDQACAGNLAAAQHIHESVRETVRALRALPDFSRSPTQRLLASKRCRPKHREKLVNVRPLCLWPRNPESQPTQLHPEPRRPSRPEPGSPHSPFTSPQRPRPPSDDYMEMKSLCCPPESKREGGKAAGGGNQSWEASHDDEETKEGLEYMMMSPQSSPVRHQDDYMPMASLVPQNWPGYFSSSLHSSFNSSSSAPDCSSPLQPSYQESSVYSLPHWPLSPIHKSRPPSSPRSPSSPLSAPAWPSVSTPRSSSSSSSELMSPPGRTSPMQPGPGRSRRVPPRSRSRLSWCLPTCLQSEDTI